MTPAHFSTMDYSVKDYQQKQDALLVEFENISTSHQTYKQKLITIKEADDLTIRREKDRIKMKVQFFWIILSSYIFILLLSAGLLIGSCWLNNNVSIITIILTSAGGLISTTITLPITIAKNLFQLNEADNIDKLKNMQDITTIKEALEKSNVLDAIKVTNKQYKEESAKK